MRYFFGEGKRRSYFEGWYFKQQNDRQTIALIPAYHADPDGRASASIQVITGEGSWRAVFPADAFRARKDRLHVQIGESTFGGGGVELRLRTPRLEAAGSLVYDGLTPPRTPAMGPFSHVPFMQCRHEVFSLFHRVRGRLLVNGTLYEFEPGIGYIEGDRGVSFPDAYLWTQCGFLGDPHGKGRSVMLSIASIPFLGSGFTGCICCVYDGGTEYRLATYRGARVLRFSAAGAAVAQGPYVLEASLLAAKPQKLYAPSRGAMTRAIRESASCRVAYRFLRDGKTVFEAVSDQAGFEYSPKESDQ